MKEIPQNCAYIQNLCILQTEWVEGKLHPHVSSERCGHFPDRDQLLYRRCSPTAGVHTSWRRRPSHRKRNSEVTLELLDGSLPRGPPSQKDPGFTEGAGGDDTEEVRCWQEGSWDWFKIHQTTWETQRRWRENENTSRVPPGRLLRGRTASPENAVVAAAGLEWVGVGTEWKKEQSASRREEDEVSCWLALR